MASVDSKEIVDEIIAGNGLYGNDEDGYDPLVVKIVAYSNMFNGNTSYGLIYEGEDPMRYHNAPACHNPQTIWVHQSLVPSNGEGRPGNNHG